MREALWAWATLVAFYSMVALVIVPLGLIAGVVSILGAALAPLFLFVRGTPRA